LFLLQIEQNICEKSMSKIRKLKNTVQTMVFLPFFLSWVILGGLFVDIFSQNGAINNFLSLFLNDKWAMRI
jgi:ABC-type polysaccharide transport system permease subunit